ncbi:MAG: hypothetical protein K940chlam6_01702 [Chlamydiae bacterium]|nr:hypothetical protein [Chlamydiota bacterium]NGX47689.1 hypothetical protein [Chlamydiota bacterium]
MKRILLLISFLFAPIFAGPAEPKADSEEMWWCASCGLAYPASHKFCLNKDCPLFRKKK